MNDPGLDEPISNDAQAVEQKNDEGPETDALDSDDAFLKPSRWWFASTAFPLLAGTFGPMATAFNICAVVGKWRISIPPGGTQAQGTVVADPSWLIAVNVVSLVFAVIANIALLFNMARRLSFSVAQPITIIGWYLASFLLVGLVIAATYRLQLPSGEVRAMTGAYYYAIIASGIYFIIAALMTITVYGALSNHYPRQFKLTTSQRTLMLQTISFLTYMLLGSLVFSHVESWSYLDAVYWSVTTLLTIGTGDFSPETHTGRSLLFFYAFGGILILGLVIGSIRSLVLERGKKKLGARMVEKKREKVVEQLNGHTTVKLSPISRAEKVGDHAKSEKERREEEFNLMRRVQDHASARRKWTSLMVSASAWMFLWLAGAWVFFSAETEGQPELSYFDWIYFCYISLTTIGYGAVIPQTFASKTFFVLWALLAIPTLTILISNMGDTIVKGIRDLTLYLGEFTVLPGESDAKTRMKQGAHKATKGKLGNTKGPVEEPPGGIYLSKDNRDPEKGEGDDEDGGSKMEATAELAEEVEREELDDAALARQRGDKLEEDIHLYHYLLVKEIRNVMKDLNESPPRKYSYGEWAWFLRLMGEDENSPKHHRPPPAKPTPDEMESGPQLQTAESTDVDEEMKKWSWLGARSPLMGDTGEAEWVLERLSMTLERQLRSQREKQKKEQKGSEGTKDGMKSPGPPSPGLGEDGSDGKLSRGSSRTLDEGAQPKTAQRQQDGREDRIEEEKARAERIEETERKVDHAREETGQKTD